MDGLFMVPTLWTNGWFGGGNTTPIYGKKHPLEVSCTELKPLGSMGPGSSFWIGSLLNKILSLKACELWKKSFRCVEIEKKWLGMGLQLTSMFKYYIIYIKLISPKFSHIFARRYLSSNHLLLVSRWKKFPVAEKMRFPFIRSQDLILMNLVAEASESLYIFQPGGYFVRTNTSAAGMYATRLIWSTAERVLRNPSYLWEASTFFASILLTEPIFRLRGCCGLFFHYLSLLPRT